MKALSVRQPWGWAILHAGKSVENRSRRTFHRGKLLLHAARAFDPAGFVALAHRGIDVPKLEPSGIIGVVNLVDVVRDSDSPWAIPGQWHWVLEDPQPLPFIPCAGRLGLWQRSLQAEVLAKVRD